MFLINVDAPDAAAVHLHNQAGVVVVQPKKSDKEVMVTAGQEGEENHANFEWHF